jgi:hypothetical protein
MAERTCFVIIGFGKKMDYSSGRMIDLDKTYEYIIEPVFKELGFLCFRACDIKHSGVIDVPMYENILKADFVLADISTLNPNVLYELGVRHAVKKNSTLIISEKELKYPFDLGHINIDHYEHLGNAIDFGEVGRFRSFLKEKITKLIKEPTVDSPLYTLFPLLNIPTFSEKEIEEIKENIEQDGSLSDIMNDAEDAKNNNDYTKAIELLTKAKELKQDNILVIQRLALATYKSKTPNTIDALFRAQLILEELHPDSSIDLETLGLSGAINKRLFEELEENEFLKDSLRFYEKGFYIGNDYYNGINLSYLFNCRAVIQEEKFEAIADFGNARRIRRQIIELCKKIMTIKSWNDRDDDDKGWIYQTLAEAYFGVNELDMEKETLQKGAAFFKPFHKSSYNEQKLKLTKLIQIFNEKYPQ